MRCVTHVRFPLGVPVVIEIGHGLHTQGMVNLITLAALFSSKTHAAAGQSLSSKPLDEHREARDNPSRYRRDWKSLPDNQEPNLESWIGTRTHHVTETGDRTQHRRRHTTALDRRLLQDAPVTKYKKGSMTGCFTRTSTEPPLAVTRAIVSLKTKAWDTLEAQHDGIDSTTEIAAGKPVRSKSFSAHPHTSNAFETINATVSNMACPDNGASATGVSTGYAKFQLEQDLSASNLTIATGRSTRAGVRYRATFQAQLSNHPGTHGSNFRGPFFP